MKKCDSCGKMLPEDANFCSFCGYSFNCEGKYKLSKYVCLECNTQLPENAIMCPKCGKEVPYEENLKEDMMYCPTCGGLNKLGSFSCVHCGRKYSVSDMSKCILKTKSESNITQIKPKDTAAHCPRCGSTSLSANKKGFGVSKATLGTLAFGLVPGLLIGNAGANKIEVTCLKCGKKFKV